MTEWKPFEDQKPVEKMYVLLHRRSQILLVTKCYGSTKAAKADAELMGYRPEKYTIYPLEVDRVGGQR